MMDITNLVEIARKSLAQRFSDQHPNEECYTVKLKDGRFFLATQTELDEIRGTDKDFDHTQTGVIDESK